jgi:hypothetical protein
MARKIMQDKEKIREKYGPEWARLPPAQQDEIIDRCLVGPRALAADAGDAGGAGDPARFPGLRGPTGQKLVRFGDEVGAAGRGPGGLAGSQKSPGERARKISDRNGRTKAGTAVRSDPSLPLSS